MQSSPQARGLSPSTGATSRFKTPNMSNSTNTMQLVASQAVATQIMGGSSSVELNQPNPEHVPFVGPCNIAWLVQIMLTGMTLSLLLSYFRSSAFKADRALIRFFVLAISLANLASALVGWAQSFHYMVSQQRDLATLRRYIVADCIAQVPQACVGRLKPSSLSLTRR